MTLTERIKKAEAMGLRLVGFYVSPDVYEKIAAGTDEDEGRALSFLLNVPCGGLEIRQNAFLPSGNVAPMFQSAPDRQQGWPVLGLPTLPIGTESQEKSQ